MTRIRPEKEEILPRASRTFTDRETPKQAFKDALEGKSPDDHKILMFYGNGGFGKSRLIEYLSQQCGNSPWAKLDFRNPTYRNKTDALLSLRNVLRKFGKKTNVTKRLYSFMAFDLAYALWKRKARPSDPITESQLWGLEESGIVGDLLATLKDIPVAGIVPKVLVLAVKGHAAIRNFVGENRIQIHRWEEMEPYQIEQELPKLWAEDARKYFQSIAPGRTPVLFLDTYEALWETHAKGTFHSVDSWVRDLVVALHEPLWVICGRENLRWAEKRPEWKEAIESHRLGGLSKADCESFLRSCGIDAGEVIVAITGCGGKAPLYLDVAVDTWYQIKRLDRVPVSEDFHKATGRTSFQQNLDEVLNRFLMYLTPVQQRIVKLLAVPRFWDDALLAKLLKKFASRYTVEDFEEELGQYVLFERDEKTSPPRWTMHESVRESFLSELPEKRKDEVEKFLFQHYDRLLKGVKPKDLTDAHRTALAEGFFHAKKVTKEEVEAFGKWWRDRRCVFSDVNAYDLLIPLDEELLRTQRGVLGEEHTDVAISLKNLGNLCQDLGRHDAAEKYYLRSLAIFEKVWGAEHADVAKVLNNLGNLCQNLGRHDAAEKYYLRSLAIFEKVWGAEHADVAMTLNNFGALCQDLGRHEEAEKRYLRSLAIYEKVWGPEHADVAMTLHNLGILYSALGQHEEAEKHYLHSLAIKERVWGPEHADVAMTLNSLGILCMDLGQHEEAEKHYLRSLAIKEKVWGPEHAAVAATLNNLGILYNALGRHEEAEKHYLHSLAIKERVWGPEHADVADTLNNLGAQCNDLSQHEEAEKYLVRALAIKEKLWDPEHSTVAIAMNRLGILYSNMGRNEEAEKYYLRALAIFEKVLGQEHTDVQRTRGNLIELYRAMGRDADVDRLIEGSKVSPDGSG